MQMSDLGKFHQSAEAWRAPYWPNDRLLGRESCGSGDTLRRLASLGTSDESISGDRRRQDSLLDNGGIAEDVIVCESAC